MKTFSLKSKDITRKWYILDASEAPLGRLSTVAASLLLAKGKTTITPHMDGGDFVIIINSDSLVITGNKALGKVYYRHSGFPGGLRQKSLGEIAANEPDKLIRHSVRGMLPDNKLRRARLARLKIYSSSDHHHQAQNAEPISLVKKDKK